MHKKLLNSVRFPKGLSMALTKVRLLTGAADEEGVSTPQSAGFKPTATGYSRHGWLPRRTAVLQRAQFSNSSVALAGISHSVRPLKGLCYSRTNKVRPLKGAADETQLIEFQSVGFWKAILKLTGTACLALALISILTINLINSNYYSPKLANAVSTNTTNASSSSPYISLSLSSATGSSDPSNGSNIAIQVPDAGGLATGSHTLTIKTNAIKGYNVTLSSNSEQTGLVNTDGNGSSGSGNSNNSNSSSNNGGSNTTATTTTISTITTNGTLANNTWGYSLTKPSDNNSPYIGIKPKSSPDTILESNSPTGTDQATDIGKQQAIYYGVNVPDLNSMKAGDYTAEVVYTATANTLPVPEVSVLHPAAYQFGDTTKTSWSTLSSLNKITSFQANQLYLAGANLDNVTTIYIDLNRNGRQDSGEACTDINKQGGALLTCYIPSDADKFIDIDGNATVNANRNTNLAEGSYDIHIFNGETDVVKRNGFSYVAKSVCRNADGDSDCQVDIDANMIPIKYTGNTSSPSWAKADVSKKGDWYDYGNKKWANAVTVTSSTLSKYKNAAAGANIPESDVLGYWVYIPRYAYEVMRPNAVDKLAYDQNFAIKFEKVANTKKSPSPTCSSGSWSDASNAWSGDTKSKDYRLDCGIDRNYSALDSNKANNTTWATHPTFTWRYTQAANGINRTDEYNGVWMGKYETTGGYSAPTIKPNNSNNAYADIDKAFVVSKSMGVLDKYAVGGDDSIIKTQNNNNLSKATTHLAKNSEWGAAAYLSASEYGAGVNGVKRNAYNTDSTLPGERTGCGPSSSADTEQVVSVCNQYNTKLGQMSSTTNNVYGIYGMSAGPSDQVSAGYSNSSTESLSTVYKSAGDGYREIKPLKSPYIDIYPSAIFKGGYVSNINYCTWATCGGQAISEVMSVTTYDAATRNEYITWGHDNPAFTSSEKDYANKYYRYAWLSRGQDVRYKEDSGVFAVTGGGGGDYIPSVGYRSALLVK